MNRDDFEEKQSFAEKLEALWDVLPLSAEHFWWSLLYGVCIMVLVFLCLFVTADKRVNGYYLTSTNKEGVQMTCVYASSNWHPDELVYCSTNINETIEQVRQLNQK